MGIHVVKKEQQNSSDWSGGTTTELFIYPSTSSYQKRNFNFRISTATVNQQKSNFTSLPGFKRHLMVLDGELLINHENRYKKLLKKFDKDFFDGEWETNSEGKVIDFNLMLNKNFSGNLSCENFSMGETKWIEIQHGFIGYYLLDGELICNFCNNTEITLKPLDFIIIEQENQIQPFKLIANSNTILIEVKVK